MKRLTSAAALASRRAGRTGPTLARGTALKSGPANARHLTVSGGDARGSRNRIKAFGCRVHLLLRGVVIGREPLYPPKAVNN